MNFEKDRNTHHMEEYPIPKSLWESLEAVLFTKGNQLAKDLAKELNVPVQPLLAELRLRNSNKFVLIPDMEDTQYQCQGFKNHGDFIETKYKQETNTPESYLKELKEIANGYCRQVNLKY